MSVRKKLRYYFFYIIAGMFPLLVSSAQETDQPQSEVFHSTLTTNAIARELGFVPSENNQCGGFYLEPPFNKMSLIKDQLVRLTGKEAFYTQQGTSRLEEEVTIARFGQQLTAYKALLYRDPTTGKLKTIEVSGDVHYREPNTLVVGDRGIYDVDTQAKVIEHVYYRTALNGKAILGPKVSIEAMKSWRQLANLSLWGDAHEFAEREVKIYELKNASFSTCPPVNPIWHFTARHLTIDKNTGYSYAKDAKFFIKNIPIFYSPYLRFSSDRQRKTGFLWPIIGPSNKWGVFILTPFYWNLAPNYDMLITPGYLSKRGLQLSDQFRYLTSTTYGRIGLTLLPHDKYFAQQQKKAKVHPEIFSHDLKSQAIINAERRRLVDASATRAGIFWRNKSHFNNHWSSTIDFNYASDDYYFRDYGHNLNETTQNQLLQLADINYSSQHWNFIGRLQAYQTLHPVREKPVRNQYRRLPQLVLNADYPDSIFGLEYFMTNEVTHFDILKNPGVKVKQPLGNRAHLQPGISLPIYDSYYFINPRLQFALTKYQLHQVTDTHSLPSITRALPIFDLAAGLAFSREDILFNYAYQQTLEPELYYTYIPFRNQKRIPIFDTTVNTLLYDQIFYYNRFSGIDRIGDANQMGLGVASRIINATSGFEKIRMGIGEIIYFQKRRVTLCNDHSCTDNPYNPSNKRTFSPISTFLNYNVNPAFSVKTTLLFNPAFKLVDNATLEFHYQPDERHIFNFSYGFARNYDISSGIVVNTSRNNVNTTMLSFVWPITADLSTVGRFTQDWRLNHLQEVIYGIQYDSCCWAVRLVGQSTFTNLANKSGRYQNSFYVEFNLKGLGNIGSDASTILSGIAGYNPQFGQKL